MNLKLGLLFLWPSFISIIQCKPWVVMDIQGNDLGQENPKFVNVGADCDDHVPGAPGMSRDMQQSFWEVDNLAQTIATQNGTMPKKRTIIKKEMQPEDCYQVPPKSEMEIPQKPRLRLTKTEKEEEKVVTEREELEPTECTEVIDMEPRTSIKIETVTDPCNEDKPVTHKIVFMQRRRKIKRIINRPYLVITRKVINEKQYFERIVPKVIEIREVINKPEIKYNVQEGPMEPLPVHDIIEQYGPEVEPVPVTVPVTECQMVVVTQACDPNAVQPSYGAGQARNLIGGQGGVNIGAQGGGYIGGRGGGGLGVRGGGGFGVRGGGGFGGRGGGGFRGRGGGRFGVGGGIRGQAGARAQASGAQAGSVSIGSDFNSAMNTGISAAFAGAKRQRVGGAVGGSVGGAVQPWSRSLGGATTVDNGLGPQMSGSPLGGQPASSNIYAEPHTNAYGQPVLSFQKKK